MSELQNVIILGASGNIGQPILSALLQASHFNVSVAVRSESKPVQWPSSVKVHTVDYNSFDSMRAAFAGQDAVISCITTFATHQQRAIVDAAVASGVKRFLPSEYGMDSSNPQGFELLPALATKRSQVEYLATKEKEGMSWTALIVGAFFDWSILNGYLGYDFKTKTAKKFNPGDQLYEATNVGRIAEAVVRILERPEITRNEYVYVHSFSVSPNQVLREIESVTEGKWQVEDVSLEQMYKTGRETMSGKSLDQGVVMAIFALLLGYRSDVGLNRWGDRANEWGKKLGLEDEDFRSSMEKIVKEAEQQ